MGKLAECPICHNKQSVKNKKCKCGCDLNRAKKSGKVKYHFYFRDVQGRQRQSFAGYTIKELNAEETKAKTKRIELGYLDPDDENAKFRDLTVWYLNLRNVKALKTYSDVCSVMKILNSYFGEKKVRKLKRSHLEEYQGIREDAGKAPSTIDKEIRMFKTMISRADDDDKIDPRILKAFKKIKKKLHKNGNARKRIISIPEFLGLLEVAPPFFQSFLEIAFHTGMRSGEIRQLRWSHYDKYTGVFRVPPELCKEERTEDKIVPVSSTMKNLLEKIIRCTHHDFIMANESNTPLNKWAPIKLMEKTCKKAGIPYGRNTPRGMIFHDIRRSVKTYMVEAGMKKEFRDLILGHALQGMDAHYVAPDESMLIAEMSKYTSWLNLQISENADQRADQR
jgi:integrase